MNLQEAAQLLAVCAAFDKRTASEVEAGAWHRALFDLPFEDCRLAVVRHYSESREWIMAADVRRGAEAIDRTRRAQEHAARLAERGELPEAPAAPMTAAEIEAFRNKARAHGFDPAKFGNFERAVAAAVPGPVEKQEAEQG